MSPSAPAFEMSTALVGRSPRLRHVHRMVEKLAGGRWPALIIGETGTGKEVVARSIHAANPTGPFVVIDCSAFVGPLMESELFGHRRGAFTGADRDKIGLIEAAHGGTAFLDEIGELPLDLQAKLLRVLQEKEYRPLGSTVTRRSDFRVVAATNRDLAREVEKGSFRQDLYYRLNVVTLRLPPLRDRSEDIPALLQHFFAKYGPRYSLTQEALDTLLQYGWPGNVRELENAVQHMVAVNSGPLLHTTDLPSALQNALFASRAPQLSMSMAASSGDAALPMTRAAGEPRPAVPAPLLSASVIPLAELERRAIIHALEFTRGDRLMAAHLLGIGRTTLYRKLKEYQMAE